MDRLIGGHERHAAVRRPGRECCRDEPTVRRRISLVPSGSGLPILACPCQATSWMRLSWALSESWPCIGSATGQFVPKTTRHARYHHVYSPWPGSTVRGHPPVSAGVKGRWLTKISYSQSKIASGGRPRALTPLIIAASKSLRTGAGSVVAIANRPARACTRATMT